MIRLGTSSQIIDQSTVIAVGITVIPKAMWLPGATATSPPTSKNPPAEMAPAAVAQ
jgi:hypothetical protein